MLSSYPVSCPHLWCNWKGNLVPSQFRGGADADVAQLQRAWFQCPRCERDWEVEIKDDKVVLLQVVE
jgi:hypothetical protein